jgi:hypothetical protein
MPNANTQIANLNEANLHSILAAIAELRKRVADDQRAWDKLEQRRDAASALYVTALNELNQRVREYFADNEQDPGGCVSDPPSESCLDHIDEIQGAQVREDFKRQLDEINSRNQSNMTAISAAQDDVRKDERAAYDDYQKTLDRLGRAFAQRAGTITGHGGVSQVPVLFNASELLPDRLYISTLESAGLGSNYLSGAHAFHKLWGLDPIPIRSLEELLDDTIRRRSKPNRVRIVSHGTPVGLRLRMFKEGILELDEERFETFLEGTLPLFRYLVGYAGFDERPPGRRVAAAIRRDPRAADVVSTFGLGNPTRQVAAFLFYEALLRSKAYEAPAGVNAAVLEEALNAITKLLRTRLRTIYGVDAATVRKLQRASGGPSPRTQAASTLAACSSRSSRRRTSARSSGSWPSIRHSRCGSSSSSGYWSCSRPTSTSAAARSAPRLRSCGRLRSSSRRPLRASPPPTCSWVMHASSATAGCRSNANWSRSCRCPRSWSKRARPKGSSRTRLRGRARST